MSDSLNKKILRLAVPAVVTNVTTPLLALCDVAIVGHMGAAVYIAAIAVGGTMFNMLYWLCGFLRMGSSGTTAQACGTGNLDEAYTILARALSMGFILGILFILLRHPLAGAIMWLVDASGETRQMALEYFFILIWGAPAVLGTFALTGWFLGMQNSRIPMWVSIFINVANIAVSLTLVLGLGFKIEGVAYGTLIAQWSGFLLAIIIGLVHFGVRKVTFAAIIDLDQLKRFFRINSDIFLRTLCLVAVTLWFTRVGAMQGTVMLAVNALLMQMFTIFSYILDGMAFAGEALCGLYAGRNDRCMLKLTVKTLLRQGLLAATAFTIVYFTCGDLLLSALSSDGDVIRRSHEFYGWAVAIPLVSFPAFVWDGVMIGVTHTRTMLLSMAVGAAVFFSVYLLLFPTLGNHGLWAAFLSYLFSRGMMMTLLGRRYLS